MYTRGFGRYLANVVPSIPERQIEVDIIIVSETPQNEENKVEGIVADWFRLFPCELSAPASQGKTYLH